MKRFLRGSGGLCLLFLSACATVHEQLMTAINTGNSSKTEQLLDHGVNVNERMSGSKWYGQTPLTVAAEGGHADIVNLLWEHGADVNAKSDNGDMPLIAGVSGAETPLIVAAEYGHADVAKILLDHGADIKAKDAQGRTSLMWVANNDHPDVANLLLNYGADVNAKNDRGETPLMLSAEHGYGDMGKVLLDHGANADAINNIGQTAADLATTRNHPEVVALIERHSHGEIRLEQQPISSASFVDFSREDNDSPRRNQGAYSSGMKFRSDVDFPNYDEGTHPSDFALVIGVERYPSGIPPALFADRDARAVFRHFLALGVPLRHIKGLMDGTATQGRINASLNWLHRNVKPGSTVYVYYSGHGSPGQDGAAYLVPFDVDPSDFAQTGLPVRDLYKTLNSLPARHVIIVLDACFTGRGNRSLLAKGLRPLVVNIRDGLFPNSGKLIVFSSSRSDQESGVLENQGHGVFTYYFLKGLNGGAVHNDHVTAEGLYRYLKPKVVDEANLDNRSQVPQLQPSPFALDVSVRLR